METMKRYSLEKLHFPVDGYNFIVKTWASVDGGKDFYFCGIAKYFRTETEATVYKADLERKVKTA